MKLKLPIKIETIKAESPMDIFKDIRALLQRHDYLLQDQNTLLERQNNLLQCQKNHLTVDDLSVYAGISTSWIYKLTSAGLIPFHKSPTGKMLYFKRQQIDEWLLSKPATSAKSTIEFQNDLKKEKIKVIFSKAIRQKSPDL